MPLAAPAPLPNLTNFTLPQVPVLPSGGVPMAATGAGSPVTVESSSEASGQTSNTDPSSVATGVTEPAYQVAQLSEAAATS